MATQALLRFGGLTIANPANGYDWYEPASHDNPAADYIESSIPGTRGRQKIITGSANQEASSLKLEWEGEVYFATAAAMESWIEDIQAATLSVGQNLRTVSYGYMNDGTTFTKANCDMKIRLGKLERLGNGWFCRAFTATFNQWS